MKHLANLASGSIQCELLLGRLKNQESQILRMREINKSVIEKYNSKN